MDSDEIRVNPDGSLYRLKVTGFDPVTGAPEEVVNLPWKFICWVKGYAERENNIKIDVRIKINSLINEWSRESLIFLVIWIEL
jgi:hypothetical protein